MGTHTRANRAAQGREGSRVKRFITFNDRTLLFIRADLVASVGEWADDGSRTIIHLTTGQIVYVECNVYDVVRAIQDALND